MEINKSEIRNHEKVLNEIYKIRTKLKNDIEWKSYYLINSHTQGKMIYGYEHFQVFPGFEKKKKKENG